VIDADHLLGGAWLVRGKEADEVTRAKPVEAAGEVAKAVFGPLAVGGVIPSFADFDSAIKSFAAVTFEVPSIPEADGFLFQYGMANWLPAPKFVLDVTRQLVMVDGQGGHESYLQVNFEYRYEPGDIGSSPGSGEEWWFADDSRSFAEWFAAVRENPIWRRLATVLPVEFLIAQDLV
jgi:hypothetical protein